MKIMKASRFYGVAERGYILTTKRWIIDAHLVAYTVKCYFSGAYEGSRTYELGALACLHFSMVRVGTDRREITCP